MQEQSMCAWCFLRAIFWVEGIKEREEKDAKKKKKSIGMGSVTRIYVCDFDDVGVQSRRESGRCRYGNVRWKIPICGRHGKWRIYDL
jgi:hypothetical protein